jgi:hypothetical protein
MKNKALFTSIHQDYRTPKKFYETLNEEFNFDFDPCPYNPTFNGLETEWGKCNYINPPYNRQDVWLAKGLAEFFKGKTCVFLIPARTDTKRFHDIILPHATEIRFIKGRLTFEGCKNPSPFPTMIVIFDARHNTV